MKPSSVFVLGAALLFLAAHLSATFEEKPFPLQLAYFSLFVANLGFALLD